MARSGKMVRFFFPFFFISSLLVYLVVEFEKYGFLKIFFFKYLTFYIFFEMKIIEGRLVLQKIVVCRFFGDHF